MKKHNFCRIILLCSLLLAFPISAMALSLPGNAKGYSKDSEYQDNSSIMDAMADRQNSNPFDGGDEWIWMLSKEDLANIYSSPAAHDPKSYFGSVYDRSHSNLSETKDFRKVWEGGYNNTEKPPSPVPEPATIMLFGIGVLILTGTCKRFIKRA